MTRVGVIVGSTRPGRAGVAVATWVLEQCAGVDAHLIDLAEWDLPLLNEPHHPRLRRYVHDHTLAWSAEIERCDAFVLVTPEYNHGPSAALKNALDYLHGEWAYKAVGFVGYGGVAAGARAVQALRQVALALRLVPVLEAVQLAHIKDRVADGRVLPDTAAEASCSAMLEELRRMDGVLRPVRAQG